MSGIVVCLNNKFALIWGHPNFSIAICEQLIRRVNVVLEHGEQDSKFGNKQAVPMVTFLRAKQRKGGRG